MYNVALFGAGRIGEIHSENIANHSKTCLYSIVDPRAESRKRLCRKYGAVSQTTDEAMADESVNGVLIASPTDTHAELIVLAAKAGKPIFCEKPIHLSIQRVKGCLKVVEECQVPLFMAFNRRYDPQFRHVKELLSLGKIGKIESLSITSRDPSPPSLGYIEASGGMFKDMTIHDFDMARFIIGENPVSIYATGNNLVDPDIGRLGDIDTSFVVMKFPSGAMATISNSRRSGYGYDQRIEVHGEKGLLQAKNVNENEVEQWTNDGCLLAKPESSFLQRYSSAYRAEWDHFVEVLAGKVKPECSGYDGQQALLLAEKALESFTNGKEIQL